MPPDAAPKPGPVKPPPKASKTRDQKPADDTDKEKPKPGGRKPVLKKGLEEFFGGIALAVSMTGDMHCANVVNNNAEAMADAWYSLAMQNDAVKKIIERIITGSAWGQVIFITAGTAIPIAQHHHILPSEMPSPVGGLTGGITSPPPSPQPPTMPQDGSNRG